MTLLPKPDLNPLHEAVVLTTPSAGSNTRDSADTSGGIVKQLFVGNVIQISEKFFNNDGYNWHQLGPDEYIADTTAFDWSPKTAPIPPSDDLDQAKALLYDALGQLEILQDNVAELAVVMGNLKARLDAL